MPDPYPAMSAEDFQSTPAPEAGPARVEDEAAPFDPMQTMLPKPSSFIHALKSVEETIKDMAEEIRGADDMAAWHLDIAAINVRGAISERQTQPTPTPDPAQAGGAVKPLSNYARCVFKYGPPTDEHGSCELCDKTDVPVWLAESDIDSLTFCADCILLPDCVAKAQQPDQPPAALTEAELRVRIAELMDWTDIGPSKHNSGRFFGVHPTLGCRTEVPDYTGSLDAAAQFEAKLTEDEQFEYLDQLSIAMTGFDPEGADLIADDLAAKLIMAPALARARAFILTKGAGR